MEAQDTLVAGLQTKSRLQKRTIGYIDCQLRARKTGQGCPFLAYNDGPRDHVNQTWSQWKVLLPNMWVQEMGQWKLRRGKPGARRLPPPPPCQRCLVIHPFHPPQPSLMMLHDEIAQIGKRVFLDNNCISPSGTLQDNKSSFQGHRRATLWVYHWWGERVQAAPGYPQRCQHRPMPL